MTRKNITVVSDEDLDRMTSRSRPDAPDGPPLGPEFWKKARVVHPPGRKTQLTVRLDADLVDWFKAQGKGYQTRMNAVLRSYYEAARREPEQGQE